MASELRELYQEVILDHTRNPRNLRAMGQGSARAEGYNPLCGDRATIYLRLEQDTIRDASFEGKGCSISTASASMMTEALKGRTRTEALALFEAFHTLITGSPEQADAAVRELGKLKVFAGVSEFPARVKCATLAWHTMRSALEGGSETATTTEKD
jgi:nitrogen fixation NifU-like protein